MDPSHAAPQSVPQSVQVELEVYSGRPNPSWALRADQAAEYRRRLDALPAAAAAPHADDALGYRGLRVTDGAAEVRVARGGVTARRGAETRALRDEGRAFERWLVETGRGALDPALYEYVAGEVRSAP